jgi:hypothetical protein
VLYSRIDSKQINSILTNTVKYSYGFLDGVDMDQILFNQKLGEFTVDALNNYIDSQARMNPDSLHHVYEWGAVGSAGGRLFSITPKASKRVINFTGKFLKSSSTSPTSDEPFYDKAEIMENSIDITVEPRDGSVLAFEDDGEMVFTSSAVYIANPGGDEVAGSFGRVVDEFFMSYFTYGLLQDYLSQLAVADEYTRYFASGAKGGGRATGISAGKKYIGSTRMEIE